MCKTRQLILSWMGEHFGFIDETRNPNINNIQENDIAHTGQKAPNLSATAAKKHTNARSAAQTPTMWNRSA